MVESVSAELVVENGEVESAEALGGRPALVLELLGCSFLFERPAGFLGAGFAG
jgi:hypothetical protein